jgi:hypothetical protein
MATVTFDTLKYSKKLVEAGYTQQQAEAAAEVQKDVLNEALDATLATKEDIRRLELELAVMKWMLGTVLGGIVALLIKAFIR